MSAALAAPQRRVLLLIEILDAEVIEVPPLELSLCCWRDTAPQPVPDVDSFACRGDAQIDCCVPLWNI
jgi:hypothetical protein